VIPGAPEGESKHIVRAVWFMQKVLGDDGFGRITLICSVALGVMLGMVILNCALADSGVPSDSITERLTLLGLVAVQAKTTSLLVNAFAGTGTGWPFEEVPSNGAHIIAVLLGTVHL
jgi:hypothetical protein